MTDTLSIELPGEWRDVSDKTDHEYHWHHGEEGDDDWYSLRMADESSFEKSLHAVGSGWGVEIYPVERDGDPAAFQHCETREEAIEAVEELMEEYPE